MNLRDMTPEQRRAAALEKQQRTIERMEAAKAKAEETTPTVTMHPDQIANMQRHREQAAQRYRGVVEKCGNSPSRTDDFLAGFNDGFATAWKTLLYLSQDEP